MAKRRCSSSPPSSPEIVWDNLDMSGISRRWAQDRLFYISLVNPHPNSDELFMLVVDPARLKREFDRMLRKLTARERGFLCGRNYMRTVTKWLKNQYWNRNRSLKHAALEFYDVNLDKMNRIAQSYGHATWITPVPIQLPSRRL